MEPLRRLPPEHTGAITFVALEEVPSFLPQLEGRVVSFEFFSLQEFHASYPGVAAKAQTAMSNPPARLILPSARALLGGTEAIREKYRIPARPAAFHVFARVSPGWPFLYECGIAFRPELGYAFVASFYHCLPPYKTERQRRLCYHVRCVPLAGTDSHRETASKLVGEELDSLQAGAVSVASPRLGDMTPLLRITTTSIGDGAVTSTFDFDSRRPTVSYSMEQIDALPGPERKRAIAELRQHSRSWLKHRPPTAAVSPERAREGYATLTSVHELLFRELPTRTWPPFATLAAAERFVRERVDGGSRETTVIGRLLSRGRRRPKATAFAANALHGITGLKPDTIRRLIRD